jgi:hypothetical protein
MRLESVHFAGMIPIPGTDAVERNFYASEGWTIERADDGQIHLSGNGREFAADGFSYTYEVLREPERSAVFDRVEGFGVEPATDAGKKRRRKA